MKFVYNEEKNKEMRHILMMQPTVEEGRYRWLCMVCLRYSAEFGGQV